MDMNELNEVATLLHVTSEIATNHPQLSAIQRACQRRLAQINVSLTEAEIEQAANEKKARDEQAAKDHVPTEEPLREGDELLDQPVETLLDNSGATVERRV